MRYILPALLLLLLMASCKKEDQVINNTIIKSPDTPPYIITGLRDITLQNSGLNYSIMPLSLDYENSRQEHITLSLSGLPGNVSMDTNWVHAGIPPFSTTLIVADTTDVGAIPGIYTLTLTTTNDSGVANKYPIHLKILPMPSAFLGTYTTCTCGYTPGTYVDSVYADPLIANKVWFTNFAGTGNKVYGLVSQAAISIPQQTVGGITFKSSVPATSSLGTHMITFSFVSINAISYYLHMK